MLQTEADAGCLDLSKLDAQELNALVEQVSANPKAYLPHWRTLFPSADHLVQIYQSGSPQYRTWLLNLLKAAVKGSSGISKSRARYMEANERSARSFTSLSENVMNGFRAIWTFGVIINRESEKEGLELMRCIAMYNSLSGFLAQDEIVTLIKGLVENYTTSSIQLAACAARSMSGFVDDGLALSYLKACQKLNSPLFDSYFNLLDPEDPASWTSALDLIQYGLNESFVLPYIKLADMMLARPEIKAACLEPFFVSHVLRFVIWIEKSSEHTRRLLLKSLLRLAGKFDFGKMHHMIVSSVGKISMEDWTDDVYQLLGTFVSSSYPFHIDEESLELISRLLLDHSCEQVIWALANLAGNQQVLMSPSDIDQVAELIDTRDFNDVDEHLLASAIRCLGALCQRTDTLADRLVQLATVHLTDGSAPKVQWTCANALRSNISVINCEKIIEPLTKSLEDTAYYKVAIAVGQCLSALLRTILPIERPVKERIKRAVLGQRFTLREAYSESYQQTLRQVNSELLSLLDA